MKKQNLDFEVTRLLFVNELFYNSDLFENLDRLDFVILDIDIALKALFMITKLLSTCTASFCCCLKKAFVISLFCC